MSKKILTVCLVTLFVLGTLVEVTPALARRGADDSLEKSDDRGRGRGRGQDDFLEGHQHQEGRRGKHHLQGEDHPRHRSSDGDRNLNLKDDSTGRGGGRGRGQDDR